MTREAFSAPLSIPDYSYPWLATPFHRHLQVNHEAQDTLNKNLSLNDRLLDSFSSVAGGLGIHCMLYQNTPNYDFRPVPISPSSTQVVVDFDSIVMKQGLGKPLDPFSGLWSSDQYRNTRVLSQNYPSTMNEFVKASTVSKLALFSPA